MEFHIRQGSTDPILKMRMIDDGKNDKSSFNDMLATGSTITLDMYNIINEEPLILGSECLLTNRTKKYNYTTDEYYITHRFTTGHTENVGRFEGKVTITFDNGNILILPVKEKLYINIF